MATAVKEDTFTQEVLESEKPVIVDFWAEWCGPCHAVAPVLDRIVEERDGELKLVKVNIDEERGLAERYGIASIPTMILFKDGEPAQARSAHSRRARSSAASASPPSSSILRGFLRAGDRRGWTTRRFLDRSRRAVSRGRAGRPGVPRPRRSGAICAGRFRRDAVAVAGTYDSSTASSR